MHEFVTGGGWYSQAADVLTESLAREGRAMLLALAEDFLALDGVSVDVLRDVRYEELEFAGCTTHPVRDADQERRLLSRLASEADWTLIIAPEFSGHLRARCRIVEQGGGTLLGCDSQLVALLSDKHATVEHLAARGLRVPHGVALQPGERLPADFQLPAVLKPRDGAGSQGIEFFEIFSGERRNGSEPARLEVFCPGAPCSVAVLCGPDRVVPLVPCRQALSSEGRFAYLGGSLPLPAALAQRAIDLAARAVAALDQPLGYVGIDLVLGEDANGASDTIIEINPRLTTSYVGLRALAETNLAGAMLAVAEGSQPKLSWRGGSIQFDSSGTVRWNPPSGGI